MKSLLLKNLIIRGDFLEYIHMNNNLFLYLSIIPNLSFKQRK